MISAFRRYLETWVVRGFFLIMVVAFVVWGIGDVVRDVGHPTWVAKVDGQTIEGPVFQAQYQRALNQAIARMPQGQNVSAALRTEIGNSTLQQMIAQAAMDQQLRRLRVVTPDAAVRNAIFALPAFHDPQGKFSRQTMLQVLQNNGLTEQDLVSLVRNELSQRQVLGALASGGAAPPSEALALFQEQYEKRSADTVTFPFDSETAPAPTSAQLQRWYDNHPWLYRVPELRRIKAIVLSPQTLAADIPITARQVHDEYEQRKAEYVTPAKRSAEVVSATDEARAKALAAQWQAGADWTAMQAAAKKDGASAVELDDATQQEFPDAALARAVFAAAVGQVSPPVKGALGWYVLKVTKATPGTEKTFDQVKDQLRQRILTEKATDLMYDRANKIENLLGNGTPFDQLPGNLGLVGVAGTLDAKGDTEQGTPAPIPGPPALRQAIVAAAFRLQKGDVPELTEVQTPSVGGSAYYAVSVQDIIPPAEKPFAEVKQQVLADWTAHQKRHAAEEKAARLLTAVKDGKSLADAAAAAGMTVSHTPLVTRDVASQDMPPRLVNILFSLRLKQPTMVATKDAFLVAVPAWIQIPQPTSAPGEYDALDDSVNASVGSDIAEIYQQAVRDRAHPRINKANYDSIVQP